MRTNEQVKAMNETHIWATSDPMYTGTSYVLEILNSTSNATLSTDPRAGRVSLTQTISMTAAMVILMIITMFGNGLVLGIFYQYTPLRTVTNYFIVSLANADLLVAVLSIPIWIAYLQVDLAQFQYGEGIYRLWICIDITSGVASVLNLSFVSVDRYIHIVMPLHYYGIMTSSRAKVIIFCIWLYAIGLAMIKGIAFNWEKPNYEILVFILGFILPLLVMGWCYYKIFGEARIHEKALSNMDTARSRDRNKQFKAAKTIAAVILAFFICWCPFFALNLIYGLCPNWKIPRVLITVSKWLHYTNSALNPIIYACFNQEYRSAFRALLTRKFYQNGNFHTAEKFSMPRKGTKREEESTNGLLDKLQESKTKFKLCENLCESSL
ncbi:octopamine receptor 1-like isoform X1 [Rhopilema esculentum]|uniref:octopamine receptor 1-like isoform X1 n=2 Tax=Rhopilema esculentum TaxID=499914 RepID=UPI0031CDE65D